MEIFITVTTYFMTIIYPSKYLRITNPIEKFSRRHSIDSFDFFEVLGLTV